MSNLRFWDVVQKKRQEDGSHRLFFPTMLVCHRCHGHSGFMWDGGTVQNKELTLQLALASFGYNIAPNFGNDPPSIYSYCSCEEELTKLKHMVAKYMVLDWGEWKAFGGFPRSGITDYSRIVEMGREFTKIELETVCEYLRKSEDCPGWTGVHGEKIKHPGTYRFTTTWDSSG